MEALSQPGPARAAPPPLRILALLVLAAMIVMAAVSHRRAKAAAREAAREHLAAMHRAATGPYLEQRFSSLARQAALLAGTAGVVSALSSGDAARLTAELAGLWPSGKATFWLAATATGRPLGTNAPDCAASTIELVMGGARPLVPGAVLCGARPAFVVPARVESAQGAWLVLGERVDDELADELSRLTSAEVLLWGPGGLLATSMKDAVGRRVPLGSDEGLQAALRGGAHAYFGSHELDVPVARAGALPPATSTGPAGVVRASCLAYVGDLDPSNARSPLRLVLVVPEEWPGT